MTYLFQCVYHCYLFVLFSGRKFYPDYPIEDLHKMRSLRWPNTVQLTLSIQHSSEIMLLFRRDALPAIEHLNVTNEEIPTDSSFGRDKSVPIVQLREHDLRQIADSCRLRSLLIRYIPLGDFVILIGSLRMPTLEKLTLVDLYDSSKLSLREIQYKVICSFYQLFYLSHFDH